VDYLHHNHQDGSVHWILEFSGSRPGSVLVRTAGRRVVRRRRLVEVSPEDLRRLDEALRQMVRWQPGTTSYCDVRLRRFHGETLTSEETRLGVMPGPEEGCRLLMRLCQSVPRTREETDSGWQLSTAIRTALVTVLLAPVFLLSLLGRTLSHPRGLVRSRTAS
jgi:hypothetical protein